MAESYRLSFAGAPELDTPPRVGILPVPYDRTASYQVGTRSGPDAIIHASLNLEEYDEALGVDASRMGIVTFAPLEPHADGPRAMLDRVRDRVRAILDAGIFPVVLGGDHAITVGAFEAVRAVHPGVSVLQLDAHADMRDEYEGSRWSHASVMRRVRELAPAISLGIRAYSQAEAAEIAARDLPVSGVTRCREAAGDLDSLLGGLGSDVYITLDVDVFDPSVMPATGTPEPGGLLWHEVDAILGWVTTHRRVLGLDVVELMPIPMLAAPDFMVARLVYRTIGRVLLTRSGG